MSYADDACAYRFSEDQIAAMRANLEDEKPELLYNQTPPPAVEGVELISPLEGETANFENTVLSWEPVDGALGYMVRLYFVFQTVEIQLQLWNTTETSVVINDDLNIGDNYRWKIRPYTRYDHCSDLEVTTDFVAGEVTNVLDPEASDQILLIYPSLLHSAQNLQLATQLEASDRIHLQIYDAKGELRWQDEINCPGGSHTQAMRQPTVAPGVYFVKMSGTTHQQVQRIVIDQ